MRLKDKVAIVTGAGSGIGREIALAYAREGAQVVIADVNQSGARETAAQLASEAITSLAVGVDVSDHTQVDALADTVIRSFGRIDILFNVAGIVIPRLLVETSVEDWDRTLDVNLKGTFLCMRAVAKQMLKQGSGSIINTTSVLGQNARANRSAYCASKAGIILLTQSAALELGPHGIRVNAIAPGSIETPLVLSAPSSPEALARKIAAIPLKRRGTPGDLIGPAIFLASDEAAYVTGDVLVVDGGMTAGIE